MSDPARLPLYYLDGPLAGRSYVDTNTSAGHRWRDGRGACYEVTNEIRVVQPHGRVRVVRRALCTFPPAGAIVRVRPQDDE